jgi:hypothetical protein
VSIASAFSAGISASFAAAYCFSGRFPVEPLEAIHFCDVLVTVVRYDVGVMFGEMLA